MNEILQWVQLSAPNPLQITTSQTISNLLILLYFLAWLNNKKGFYIEAFLFIEIAGSSVLLSYLSSSMFYVYYAALYAFCYWFEAIIGKNIKILLAYGIMVLFQSAMVLDAYIYPNVETSIYQSYEYIVMFIHLHIIISLINIGKLIKSLGDRIISFSNFLGIGYNLSFCYTCNTIFHKVKKTCR